MIRQTESGNTVGLKMENCFQNVIAFEILMLYTIIDIVCVTISSCGCGAASIPFVKLEGIAFYIPLKEEIAYESE